MSNKVIFNLDELFISVGIDVGADFSWMSIALPNQQFVGKPYKILHNSIDSLTTAVSKIKEAEELYSLESRIFLESTGIYHYPLFCYPVSYTHLDVYKRQVVIPVCLCEEFF